MTLEAFYHSKPWEKLRRQLMIDRLKDGQLICEHCGEPIVKAYDCIAHHKKELTEDNVNDFEISLNPDNIELIHFRCHNIQHKRFEGFSQSVYLVYGSPCSGKTTWVNANANNDDLILDIDRIWDCLCNDGQRTKPKRLKANAFGVRDCLIDQIKTRTGRWRNAFVIGGFPLRSDRERLCDLLRAEPIYIEASKEECLERANQKPDGWKDYIEDWFDSYTE